MREPSATSSQSLIVVGSSARAAAESARKAGYLPWTCDQFADADLAALGATRRINHFPAELLEAIAEAPNVPWIYAGGLENHPDWVDQMAQVRPLLGNPGSILRRIRDPQLLADALTVARLPALRVTASDSPPTSGRWMVKPLRSGGGIGVRLVDCANSPPPKLSSHYFQLAAPPNARIVGAVFVMARGECRYLGASTLHSGRNLGRESSDSPQAEETTAADFLYRGSSTCRLDPWDESAIVRAGEVVARAFQLQGVVGLDVAVQDGLAWVLEVNPRYPASAELLDLVDGPSIVERHIAACVSGSLPRPEECRFVPRQSFAKWIIYANQSFRWTEAHDRWRLAWHDRLPNSPTPFADIPRVGSIIEAGWPVCTLRTPISGLACDRAGDLAVGRELAASEQSIWQEMQRIAGEVHSAGTHGIEEWMRPNRS
jgi:predicted ATP-grasp superfamily ATP-dependent carboligase